MGAKYAYIISEVCRSITIINFRDKIAWDLCEYKNRDFSTGVMCTWDKNNVSIYAEYVSVKELISYVEKEDRIILSELSLKEIYELLNNSQYMLWESSCDVCFKMLIAYRKWTKEISLKDLIEAMQ